MNKFRVSRGIAAGLLLAVCMLGCKTTRQTRTVETTGFLGDYSKLQKGEDDQAQLVYMKQGLNLTSYKSVIIDPITVMVQKDSDLAKLSKEEMKNLSDSLYLALYNELKKDYKVVSAPAPGVLRVRAAITDARGAKVVMNTITTIIPQLNTVSRLTGMATDKSMFVGKAGVEAEVVDSQTGERFMAAVDERIGGKAVRSLGGTWKDLEEAYLYWAKKLSQRLGEVSGRPKPA